MFQRPSAALGDITRTGQWACRAHWVATLPSSSSVRGRAPWDPTTSRDASDEALISSLAGSPVSTTWSTWGAPAPAPAPATAAMVFCNRSAYSASSPAGDSTDRHDAEHRDLVARMLPLVEEFPEVPVEYLVLRGRPGRTLLEFGQHASLLVVGTHGGSAFAGLLLGSTSVRTNCEETTS